MLIGEIGGGEEDNGRAIRRATHEKARRRVIAGKNAPAGRSMGHAGGLLSADGTGSARMKERMLREAGAVIAESTAQIPDLLRELGVHPGGGQHDRE